MSDEAITDLRDANVVTKHRTAAEIANFAVGEVLKACVAGAAIDSLCEIGDNAVTERLKTCYNKQKGMGKGIAFPTCVSVNQLAGHVSPLKEDTYPALRAGDLVKVDLAVHIDGYVAAVAQSLIVAGDASAVTQRHADVLAAAYYGSLAAAEAVRAGRTNVDVTRVIQNIGAFYGVSACEGVLSHQMKHYVIDANKTILARPTTEQRVEDATFEQNEVYSVDVVYSTGDGKLKGTENRTTVYKRVVENTYALKMQAARTLFSKINTDYPTFPFSLRAFSDPKSRLGMKEIIDHSLVAPYPVLTEKTGELIAQFKTTVLLMPSGTTRVTGSAVDIDALPVKPSKNILTECADEEIKSLLTAALADKKKKKSKE